MKVNVARSRQQADEAHMARVRESLARRTPCPHCAKSGAPQAESSTPIAAAGFSQVPLSRSVKAERDEASFDDDDEGKGELRRGDAGTSPGIADDLTVDAGPVDAGPGGTADAGATPADAGTPAPPAPAAPVTTPVPSITWNAASSSTVNSGGSSTTVEQAFTPVYTATKDTAANVWRMGTTSITGGVTIEIHTGGSRDPDASPPTTENQAKEAVTVMKGYYARGSRGAWHTEAASSKHEDHHYREWKCSAEHYWAIAGPAIAALTAPLPSHADSAAAVAAMKPSADAKVASFKAAARTYWMKLSDSASSRPYAAGQSVLNTSVSNVQTLAGTKGWTVEAGVTATSGTEPPCYEAWDAYTP